MKILLVEDEKISRITLHDTLSKEGHDVFPCETGIKGMEYIEREQFDVVITDLRMPTMNGMDIVKAVKEKNSDCAVIVITAYATVETAVTALKLGAYDYLTKPFSPDRLLTMLNNIQQLREVISENARLKDHLNRYGNNLLIGNSLVMQQLLATLRAVAPTDHTVLIEGESGTGKELVARTLHEFSDRKQGPFIAVNCASLPETLLESELFGHEKGAFTGAHRRHKGYIERADSGTLFIDDIDDLPLRLQVKLLRVLQEREVQPVGATQSLAVDFRVVCATKVNLFQLVQDGRFRDDLYYRLNIIPITVPPLRDRKEDLPLLIENFIEKHIQGKIPAELKPEQVEKMMQYNWPGNVRELENVIQRLLALPSGVDFLNFGMETMGDQKAAVSTEKPVEQFHSGQSFDEFIHSREQEIIDWALDQSANNISSAARLLKLPRSTLHSKMEKLGYFNSKKKYE